MYCLVGDFGLQFPPYSPVLGLLCILKCTVNGHIHILKAAFDSACRGNHTTF